MFGERGGRFFWRVEWVVTVVCWFVFVLFCRSVGSIFWFGSWISGLWFICFIVVWFLFIICGGCVFGIGTVWFVVFICRIWFFFSSGWVFLRWCLIFIGFIRRRSSFLIRWIGILYSSNLRVGLTVRCRRRRSGSYVGVVGALKG